MVALDAREINLKEMFTTRGDGVPRIRQNTVLLLVPKSVKAVGAGNEQMGMFDDKKADEEARTRLEGIARQVLAIKALEDSGADLVLSSYEQDLETFLEKEGQ